MDPRSGLPQDSVSCLFKKGDQRLSSRLGFRKIDGGLHFGKHGTGGKMSFLYVLFCLGDRDVAQPFLIRFTVIDGSLFHRGQDDEKISIQLFGEQAACKVFVDHGAGALQDV